jgi:hypothetical protein
MQSGQSHPQFHQDFQVAPQPSSPSTDTYRTKLHQLDTTAQSLKGEKASLELQLQQLIQKIFANDAEIRHTMENLGNQLFRDQRTERQAAFIASTLANENVIEGIFYQMQANPQLMRAINNLAKEQGTLQDNNLVAAAIMTELTGNTFAFGHKVSLNVIEYEKNKKDSFAGLAAPFNGYTYSPTPTMPPFVDPGLPGPSAVTSRAASVVVMTGNPDTGNPASPAALSIKSENDSIATPAGTKAHLAALAAAAAEGAKAQQPESVVAPGSVGGITKSGTVAHGISSLQRSFPGLLESIQTATPNASAKANNKRTRELISLSPHEDASSETSETPNHRGAAKKNRANKEPGKPLHFFSIRPCRY